MGSLENVKVGDEVIFSNGWDKSIVTITKVTKTQIHIGISRFRKSDGRLVGSQSCDKARIDLRTEESERKINIENNKQKMVSYFMNYKFHLLSYEEMIKVYNFLKEIENNCLYGRNCF